MHAQSAGFLQRSDYDSQADVWRLTKHFLIAEDVANSEMLSAPAK